jgi:hypothetical protein
MTEAQWLTYAKKLETRPPMPWFNVRAMTDDDLKAVYAYIKQMPGALGPLRQPSWRRTRRRRSLSFSGLG